VSNAAFNNPVFNRVVFNAPGPVVNFLDPLSIDDRTIDGATWIDDRSTALSNYAMTKIGVKIKNLVLGDDKRIKRTYTSLPTGSVINKAWLTIKKKEKDLDAAALVQKSITTTLTAAGQITDADTTSGDLAMYFDLSKSETGLAKPDIEYLYDIQVKKTTGEIHTLERGVIIFIRGITDASS
jgi:hypothetical protein